MLENVYVSEKCFKLYGEWFYSHRHHNNCKNKADYFAGYF